MSRRKSASRMAARTNEAMKAFSRFHQQAQTCGGLMHFVIMQRRDLPGWVAASFSDKRARNIVRAMNDVLMRWDREGAGKLCLTCDNSVEQIRKIEAFAFIAPYGDCDEAMACPLCWECAERSDLQALVISALRRMAWPNLRIAPPIHAQGGHA